MTSGFTPPRLPLPRWEMWRWEMGYCTVQFPELPVHYMSPGLHQQVDCLLLPVWSLKYSLITETLKKFQPHIDAQNFNLILTHKIVPTFFLDGWVSIILRDFWTSLQLSEIMYNDYYIIASNIITWTKESVKRRAK